MRYTTIKFYDDGKAWLSEPDRTIGYGGEHNAVLLRISIDDISGTHFGNSEYYRVIIDGHYSEKLYISDGIIEYTVPFEAMNAPVIHFQLAGYKESDGEAVQICKSSVLPLNVGVSETPFAEIERSPDNFESMMLLCDKRIDEAKASAESAAALAADAKLSADNAKTDSETAAGIKTACELSSNMAFNCSRSAESKADEAKAQAEIAKSAAQKLETLVSLPNELCNPVKNTVSGTSFTVNDVSPLKHELKVKCSVLTSGTGLVEVSKNALTSTGIVTLEKSEENVHAVLQACIERKSGVEGTIPSSSPSVLVPVVNGEQVTDAAVTTSANAETSCFSVLDYVIDGTTLTVTGKKGCYGAINDDVTVSTTVAAGSKITGFAVNGILQSDLVTETCTLTVSTVQAIPTAVTVTAPDGTVSTGSASADGTVTGLNSTASPMTVSVSAGTVSVTYNRDISSCLGERANALVSQKSGSMLRIDDVSPCDNNVTVNVSAVGDNVPSKIYQFGRNILNPTPWTAPSTVHGVTYTYLPDEDCFLINGTAAADGGPRKVSPFYALGSGFITSLKYISGSITIPADQNKFASFHLGKADTTTGTASNFFSCGLQNSDNTTAVKFCDKNYWQASWFYVSAGVVFENYKIRLQVERNNSATAYEQYTAPAELTPDADGNVTAARGKVCTFAVKTPGTLSAKYNRNINKAFDELKQAIISLGGNV